MCTGAPRWCLQLLDSRQLAACMSMQEVVPLVWLGPWSCSAEDSDMAQALLDWMAHLLDRSQHWPCHTDGQLLALRAAIWQVQTCLQQAARRYCVQSWGAVTGVRFGVMHALTLWYRELRSASSCLASNMSLQAPLHRVRDTIRTHTQLDPVSENSRAVPMSHHACKSWSQ